MKFVRPKKGSAEHAEVCALMRGGDYKGEPSDYQAALRKWNEQKGWNQTNIWQMPHKGHRDVKASQAYKEVLELMEGSRTGGWNAAKARQDELLDKLPASGYLSRARVQKVFRDHLDVIQKKTKDERKWTKVLNDDIDDVLDKYKKHYGHELGAGPVAAEPEAKVVGFAPSTQKQVMGKTSKKSKDKIELPSPHEKYLATIKLFDEFLEKLPEDKRAMASQTFIEKQQEIMNAVDDEHVRVLRLQKYLDQIYPAKNRKKVVDETAFEATGKKKGKGKKLRGGNLNDNLMNFLTQLSQANGVDVSIPGDWATWIDNHINQVMRIVFAYGISNGHSPLDIYDELVNIGEQYGLPEMNGWLDDHDIFENPGGHLYNQFMESIQPDLAAFNAFANHQQQQQQHGEDSEDEIDEEALAQEMALQHHQPQHYVQPPAAPTPDPEDEQLPGSQVPGVASRVGTPGVEDPSGNGKPKSKRRIHFEKLHWGTFQKSFEEFNRRHPSEKVKDLHRFALFVIAHPEMFKKMTAKRARFYINVIEEDKK